MFVCIPCLFDDGSIDEDFPDIPEIHPEDKDNPEAHFEAVSRMINSMELDFDSMVERDTWININHIEDVCEYVNDAKITRIGLHSGAFHYTRQTVKAVMYYVSQASMVVMGN